MHLESARDERPRGGSATLLDNVRFSFDTRIGKNDRRARMYA